MPDLAPVLTAAERGLDSSIDRLKEYLRIESVSTDPAFAPKVRQAAEWSASTLADLGFDAKVVATAGHPMVLAHHPGPGGNAPRILYYGHYDVQPADPLELWESGPFDPVVVEGPGGKRIVARGAVDDKGQVMTFLEAFRAWKSVHGTPPCAVTVMLEGEEESGSPSLEPFVRAHRKELAADACVVSDTGMWDARTPAVTTRLRGLVYAEVTVRGPSHDLHSGMFGGTLPNPINTLASIVAELHDRDRRVQLDGFYDGVGELPAEIRAQWESLGFDELEYLGGAGIPQPFGEKGRTTLERMWSRPTLDCNGIFGGYTQKGAKTVIPAEATVKLSCRLVGKQDPHRVYAALQEFFARRLPAGCRAEWHSHGLNPAIDVPTGSPFLGAARRGLETVYGRPAVLIGSGGSIPAVGLIQRELGIDSLLVGFGLDDDRVHSPNEKFDLACYRGGILSHAAMLAEFARLPR
jgi:acetylornithine deacetylase/succinyl-diaminopimelate desuccinylase-like protein